MFFGGDDLPGMYEFFFCLDRSVGTLTLLVGVWVVLES